MLLRSALGLAPGTPAIEVALGAALLKAGHLREGLPLFDRWRVLRPSAPALPYPRWRGEAPAGKRILVWSEHGFGDQIQWARYALALVRAGAVVTWLCPRALAALLADLGISTLPDDQSVKLNDFDYYCPSSTLPLYFDLTLETLDGSPYLVRPEPDRRGGSIGVMTAGNRNNIEGRPRALAADQAARLLALPNAINLAPEATGARDFRETAAIMAALDMVITVDTAVAHLAGALGVPTIVLLPFVADWRWFADRLDSPWYASVRLVRQERDLNWEHAVDRALGVAS
jgi:Glycosyltransferase family 9 (heptosyltransferase)